MDEASAIRVAEAEIKKLLGRNPPFSFVVFCAVKDNPYAKVGETDEWAVHFSREKPGMDPSTFLVVVNDQTGEARVASTL